MKFQTQWDGFDSSQVVFEEHADEGLVERAGYMDTESLVTQLLVAGANLQIYREAEFSAEEEVPDDAPASVMLSQLDAELALRSVNARIRAKREAILAGKGAAEAGSAPVGVSSAPDGAVEGQV